MPLSSVFVGIAGIAFLIAGILAACEGRPEALAGAFMALGVANVSFAFVY